MGLSTLYLTSYATGLRCIALENVPEFATIARQAFAKEGRNPVDLRIGNYKDLLPQALNDINSLDFVFFNTLYEQHNNLWLFNECMKYAHNDTVFVFEGIKASRRDLRLSGSYVHLRSFLSWDCLVQQEIAQTRLYCLFLGFKTSQI